MSPWRSHRRADDDLRPLGAGVGLLVHVAAAISADGANVEDLAELAAFNEDLLRQLPRRRQNQADRTLAFLQARLVHDMHQQRPQIRRGFAASGFGDANYVSSAQRNGNALQGACVTEEKQNGDSQLKLPYL